MRVLVVEDEERIADFIRKGLSEQGYAVDLATDGEEALDWPKVAEFDVSSGVAGEELVTFEQGAE
jgi:DNA-binding response OmpR family regulator